MKRLAQARNLILAAALTLAIVGTTCAPFQTGDNAGSTPIEGETREQAVIIASETPGQFSHFTVTGSNADFGRYLALGEATFVTGQEEGVLRDGTGIAVLKAENGDQIVADVTCKMYTDGPDFTFHWRDSVTFENGTTVSNTGAFGEQRPPGLAISRARLSAVYIDGLCCSKCCTSSGLCGDYCGFCPTAPACPSGTTKR